MNRYISFLNEIKQRANLEWLTPSQRKVYQILEERVQFLDELNLWGLSGTGKTFMGWVLHRQKKGVYIPSPAHIKPSWGVQVAVLDNVPSERGAIRELLGEVRARGYAKAIFITSEPVNDQMATAMLELGEEDLERVRQNWRRIGLEVSARQAENLWSLLQLSIFASVGEEL